MQALKQKAPLALLGDLSKQMMQRVGSRAEEVRTSLGTMEIINPEEAKTKRPFGFDVHKAAREYLETKEYLAYLDLVARDGADALRLCAQVELPIIAVVPEKAWSKACTDAHLFTLYPDEEGRVAVSSDAYRNDAGDAACKVKDKHWWGGWKDREVLELEKALARGEALHRFFKHRSAESLMLDLFPGYIGGKSGSFNSVVINFPVPDADFGKALLKVKKMRIRVAVVVEAEAIDVSAFVERVLAESDEEIALRQRAVVEKKRQERERLVQQLSEIFEPCPILTFPHGAVRVVVAQYGKWPLELKAIQTALEQDLRLAFD